MQHMHGNIPYSFDFWADLDVHLLLLKSSMIDWNRIKAHSDKLHMMYATAVEGCSSVNLSFFKNGPFPASFIYFRLFYKQLTVNKCSIKVADDWIRTWVLWYHKRLLCQLRHNHFPPWSSLVEGDEKPDWPNSPTCMKCCHAFAA